MNLNALLNVIPCLYVFIVCINYFRYVIYIIKYYDILYYLINQYTLYKWYRNLVLLKAEVKIA